MSLGDIFIKEFKTDKEFYTWREENRSTITILNIDFIPIKTSSGLVTIPEVNSFLAYNGQTDFFFNINYVPGENKLKVYANGLFLTVDSDYTETGNNSIKINEPLEEGDIVSVIKDTGYFENISNDEIMNSYTISIAYEEVISTSSAMVRNIRIRNDNYGIYINWEDIFGKEYDERLGSKWREIEGLSDNILDMPFLDWKNVKIVRKEDSAPTNIDDGIVVFETNRPNSHLNIPFFDDGSNLVSGTTYFYGIFPCDIWSIYNVSSKHIVSIYYDAPTWESDKDNFKLSFINNADGNLLVRWNDPEVSQWKGTKLLISDDYESLNIPDLLDVSGVEWINGFKVLYDNTLRHGFSDRGYTIKELDFDKTYYIRAVAYDFNNLIQLKAQILIYSPSLRTESEVINFNDDIWKNYFFDIESENVEVIDISDKKYLSIKSGDITYNSIGKPNKVITEVKLKPINFEKNGTVTVFFKVYTDVTDKFEILVSNNERNNQTISGYYVDFDYRILNISASDAEITFRLSSHNSNGEVLIDRIIIQK